MNFHFKYWILNSVRLSPSVRLILASAAATQQGWLKSPEGSRDKGRESSANLDARKSMSNAPVLKISGEITVPRGLAFADLAALPPEDLILDVGRIDPKRSGDAVTLDGLLKVVGVKPNAKYLGLHSATDNFHASIPLGPIRGRAFLIFRLNGQPLTEKQGGPFRFYIPDFAACHTHEIDECANVKFVDHIELTAAMGFDNRPHDGAEHAALHERQAS
jgi:hypothetical protein